MESKPQIIIEQFIQEHAQEFYLIEQKRKQFGLKFISSIAITSVIGFGILIYAFTLANHALGFFIYCGGGLVLFIGLIITIVIWISFQESYKSKILKLLIKEFFPELNYEMNGLKSNNTEQFDEIGYKSEFKTRTFRSEDLIHGPIGHFSIQLFEVKVDSKKNKAGDEYKFRGIILEIQNIPLQAKWEELFQIEEIAIAYEKIFHQHKANQTALFQSPNGNWYIFLKHSREDYLEPRKFKKSFEQEYLSETIKDIYCFITFVKVLDEQCQYLYQSKDQH